MSEYLPVRSAYRAQGRTAAAKDAERVWSRVVLGAVIEEYVERVRAGSAAEPSTADSAADGSAHPGYHATRSGDRVRVSRDNVEIGSLLISPDETRSDEELLEDAVWLAASEDARWLMEELEYQHATMDEATHTWWGERLDEAGVYDVLAGVILARIVAEAHAGSSDSLQVVRAAIRATIDAYCRDIAESVYCHAMVWAKIELFRHFPEGELSRVDQRALDVVFAGSSESGTIVADAMQYTLGIWEVDLGEVARERPEVKSALQRVTDRRTRAAIERFTGRTPAPAVTFNAPALTFLNDPHTHAVIRSMWDMANWRSGEWQLPQYRHDGVRVYVTDGPDDKSETLDAAWQRVLELDDNTASTFLICIGKWFADTGGDNADLPKTSIHVADVLGFRGIRKHAHGGYRPEQKEEARRHILALNHIWVQSEEEVYEARGRKKRVRVDSRLLEVALESEPGSDGTLEPYAFRIAPGEWARSYLGTHNRLTAQLLQPVMAYDPYRQRMAMRLGIYLASQWRIRASSRNYEQPWRVKTLLAGASLDLPERNLQRFRDQLENALDQLQEDGVIAAWEYERDSALPDRQWFPLWLDWTVRITPPQEIVEHYASIGSGRTKAIARAKRAGDAGRQRE